MTGTELLEHASQLNGGAEPNNTLFFELVNMFKTIIEGMRPWMFLRKVDSSQTITAATTSSTQLSLPTDFKKPFLVKRPDGSKTSLMLRNSAGAAVYLQQIPFGTQESYRDISGYWWYDIRASKFYVSGTWNETWTVYLNYIYKSVTITTATEWAYPDEDRHPVLADLAIAAIKSGQDYDEINARQAIDNNRVASMIINSMVMEDDELQRSQYNI